MRTKIKEIEKNNNKININNNKNWFLENINIDKCMTKKH